MQPWTYETEAERRRAGDYELYTRIAQTATRQTKRSRNPFTEQGWDALLILAFAGGFGLYLLAQVVMGLPAVLTRHGLI